jgi:hypothetical protein
MPKIYKLALILLNIPCSSALVERFFSICGLICKNRSFNMRADLIRYRENRYSLIIDYKTDLISQFFFTNVFSFS